VPRATCTVFSSIPRARSENQNSRPALEQQRGENGDQHGRHARDDGEDRDQAGVEPAAAEPPLSARATATCAEIEHHQAIAGSRIATSSSAISGGDSKGARARARGSAARR
jgi:hypothetical protein